MCVSVKLPRTGILYCGSKIWRCCWRWCFLQHCMADKIKKDKIINGAGYCLRAGRVSCQGRARVNKTIDTSLTSLAVDECEPAETSEEEVGRAASETSTPCHIA
ncbi:hypothetical protein ATANTOWER_021621 [Ataeniobius toweri]|uniref:Uncharacterized protein n=1 Tax=Ataeniobius toweri TaxID=208326 RepID=A0ABU7CM04_9TELE|nr:hypothetical protein [Ataeniobius toweri]